MRCSDPAVVTATEQLLNAKSDVEDTARLEAALEGFGPRRRRRGCPGGHGDALSVPGRIPTGGVDRRARSWLRALREISGAPPTTG